MFPVKVLRGSLWAATLVILVTSGKLFAATAVYSNGWSGGSGTGGEPTAADHVVMQAGDLSWTPPLPASVQSWTQGAAYSNTVTFETTYPDFDTTFTQLTVVGNCTLNSGTWKHLANGNGQAQQRYWLGVRVGGNFDLSSGATINVNELGYDNAGPGQGGGQGGASHGGAGNSSTVTYGDYDRPTSMGGAGGSYEGGGVINLVVAGSATVDGTMTADGHKTGDRSAAGGSVMLTVNSLSGNGTLNADGGSSTISSGGGRIAVILTGAGQNFSSFTGQMHAYGLGVTRRETSAGTIYLQTGDGKRTILIDNNGKRSEGNRTARIPDPGMGKSVWTVDEIIVRDGGVLDISSNAVLNLTTDSITNNGTTRGYIKIDGGVFNLPIVGGTNVLNVPSNVAINVDSASTITGTMTLLAGGWLSHSRIRSTSTTEDFKMDLTIVGDLVVTSNGAVNVEETGFANTGPGSHSFGCAYGGRGPNNANTYGSILAPFNYGSGGAWHAGGAARLTVTGTTQLDGLFTSNGGSGGDRSACGGSIYLTTATLTGGGSFRANGTAASLDAGGGRIAVLLTAGTFDAFEAAGGTLQATSPNNNNSAPGTVHLKCAGRNEVIIDGNGVAQAATDLPPVFQGNATYPTNDFVFDDDLSQTTLIVTNSGRLQLVTNDALFQLIVATSAETIDLGDAPDTLELVRMTVNGTNYSQGGSYTIADWNGQSAPPNVSGSGRIVIPHRGMVLQFR